MSTIIGLVSTFRLPLHPPLQHPICRGSASLLDFNTPSHRFNVQFAALWLLFWTSTRLPSTLTSNPPLHGYPITPARQKAPARMLFTSILAGANPHMYHKFYFPDVALSLAIALASAALE